MTGLRGGSTPPGGSDTQLQRNNAGAFGGVSGATSDGISVIFTAGNLKSTGAQTLDGNVTIEGLTTTSPSVFAQITGDTVPRIRMGINATDIASLSFGDGTNSRDLFVERSSSATLRLGQSDAAAPVAQTLGVQNVVTGTTDTAGASFRIVGSRGTGTGTGGSLVFRVYPASTTGSTQNAIQTIFTLSGAAVPTAIINSASFGLSGNISAPAWTTSGIRYANVAATLTDTTSSGTVATAYTDLFGGNTIVASSATTYTKYATLHITAPTASTNVTFTNSFALDADSLSVGTSNPVTITTAGAFSMTGTMSHGTEINTGNGAASVSQVLWNGTVFAGGTATNTFPAMFVQPAGTPAATTWSTSGTGLGMNLASGFAGNFLDFRVAGGTTLFTVTSSGGVNVKSTLNMGTQAITAVASLRLNANSDAQLTSPGTASVQLGASDAAVAVAQTLRVQSVVAGTAATNGANWTLIGSLPTGTGTSGDIIFQTGVKTGSGTTQGTATTALTIKGETQAITIASGKSLVLGNAAATGLAAGVLAATTNATIIITDSTGQAYRIPCII